MELCWVDSSPDVDDDYDDDGDDGENDWVEMIVRKVGRIDCSTTAQRR